MAPKSNASRQNSKGHKLPGIDDTIAKTCGFETDDPSIAANEAREKAGLQQRATREDEDLERAKQEKRDAVNKARRDRRKQKKEEAAKAEADAQAKQNEERQAKQKADDAITETETETETVRYGEYTREEERRMDDAKRISFANFMDEWGFRLR
jgi:flagellar biosynthesis/type III secretory pathway protein FliH